MRYPATVVVESLTGVDSGSYTGSVARAFAGAAPCGVRSGRFLDGGPSMTESGPRRGLINDTAINVVGLLQSEIGDHREYVFRLDSLPLGVDLTARHVAGGIRLTLLRDRILADVVASADVDIECVRCLRTYSQPARAELAEEYWQTVDVRTGYVVDPVEAVIEEEERFTIDDNHELDLREALRQHLVLALPMKPDCGDECPGPPGVATKDDSSIDHRFAALADLLEYRKD